MSSQRSNRKKLNKKHFKGGSECVMFVKRWLFASQLFFYRVRKNNMELVHCIKCYSMSFIRSRTHAFDMVICVWVYLVTAYSSCCCLCVCIGSVFWFSCIELFHELARTQIVFLFRITKKEISRWLSISFAFDWPAFLFQLSERIVCYIHAKMQQFWVKSKSSFDWQVAFNVLYRYSDIDISGAYVR